MNLTPSQDEALKGLLRWFNGHTNEAVLHAPAGYGKTFLIDIFLKELGNRAKPLLLADTNEAVNVLKKVTGGKYDTQTICSAFNLVPRAHGANKVLTQMGTPDFSQYTLFVVDEASQLDDFRLELIAATGKLVLYCGHKSQLPPVIENLSVNDPCISPVFTKDYLTFSLTHPVRNITEIFEFCTEAEELVYKRGVLSKKFQVDKKFFGDYLLRKETKEEFLTGETVLLAYTNNRVVELNEMARMAIYGQASLDETFLAEDKLIFRHPTALFEHPINNVRDVSAVAKKGNTTITTNSRGRVINTKYKDILGVTSYELYVEVLIDEEKKKGFVYVPIDMEAHKKLTQKLYHDALYEHDVFKKGKKWDKYHDLSLILSSTRHSYALTIHCSQGSTINNVFIDDNDTMKCSNSVLRRKLGYVGYSRAKNNLYRLK